jgi:hypothetical protein
MIPDSWFEIWQNFQEGKYFLGIPEYMQAKYFYNISDT